jgi:hypothetical protein
LPAIKERIAVERRCYVVPLDIPTEWEKDRSGPTLLGGVNHRGALRVAPLGAHGDTV